MRRFKKKIRRAPSRIRKRREKRRRFPPTQVVVFRAPLLAAAQVSRLPCLRLFPPKQTSGKLKGKKCGSIATTAWWCFVRTIGITFRKICISGTESHLPSPIPSPLGHPSKAVSVSGATTAAKSISINPQKCSNPNWSFLTLSLPIRYFEIFRGSAKGLAHRLSKPRISIGRAGGATDIEIDDPRVSVLHCAVAVSQKRIRLYDLDSTSGTYVNDERIETAELEHLAEFRVGSSLLLVTILPKREPGIS